MAPKWPQVNNGPEHINEHATYLKEACNQLQAVEKGRYNQVPWNIVQTYLDSTLVLIGKVLRQPALREILEHVKDAAKCTQNIQHDVTVIKNSVGLSTASLDAANFGGRRSASRSWAQVAAQPTGTQLPPPPTQDNVSTTRTNPTVTAYKDRVVTVKLKDSGVAERYRKHSAAWVRQQVASSIQNNTGTKRIKVVAAYQLKSGDIQIFTSTTTEAAKLKENTGWLGGLGENAEVIVPTYGVIVHGIPTNSINIKNQKATIEQILSDNHTVIPQAKISHVGWLTKEGTLKRASSIVVEFTDPVMANATIYAGMAWEGQIHQCQLYDRACRIKQCFRCYNYGHITTQCNASQTCGYCAEHHETKTCPRKGVEGFTPRCAVCKDCHTAWSNACPARKKESKRIEQAKDARSIYWHVPVKNGLAEPSNRPTRDVDGIDGTREAFQTTNEPQLGELVTTTTSEATSSPPQEPAQHQPPTDLLGSIGPMGIQILVTPPAGIEGEGHHTTYPAQLRDSQLENTMDPLLRTDTRLDAEPNTSMYPLEGLEGLAMQEADAWLAGVDHADGDNWLSAITPNGHEELETSPLTSIATDSRTAHGVLYKPCKCPAHQGIYDNWPTQDADLTLAKCMKTCMYCGKEFNYASDLRKHINNSNAYVEKNLKAVVETAGKQQTLTPSWVRRDNTGTNQNQRRTRSSTHIDSTNAATSA